jgi:alpha-ketoglutarate-dependent taurine dioxygenase
MNVATKSRLNVSRLSPHIGAEVRDIDLRQTLDASTIAAIHDAWLDHSVIIFRNQELSQEDLLRVTAISANSASLPVRPSSFPRVIRGCCPIS